MAPGENPLRVSFYLLKVSLSSIAHELHHATEQEDVQTTPRSSMVGPNANYLKIIFFIILSSQISNYQTKK